MKVKELIKKLLDMPLNAEVFIDVRQSTNSMTVDSVYNCGNTMVSIVADYQDFELDEEAMDTIEREKAEEGLESAIDMALKNYKENEVPR